MHLPGRELLAKVISFLTPSPTFSSSEQAAWTHAASDAFMMCVYFLSLAILGRVLRKKKNLPHRKSFFFFGAFLFCAGCLHALALNAPYYPLYGVLAAVKALAASFALVSALCLLRLVPRALAAPTHADLDGAIAGGEREKSRRLEIEKQLRLLQAEFGAKSASAAEAIEAFEARLAEELSDRRQIEGKISEAREAVCSIDSGADFHSVLEIALKKLVGLLGCDYGELWMPSANGRALELALAQFEDSSFESFWQISKELRFPVNVGFTGLIWARKEPLWIEDVADEKNNFLARRQIACESGIRSALGIPVITGGAVMAALVFFSKTKQSKAPRLAGLVSIVAGQIGAIVERNEAEGALEEARAQLEQKIKERTEELSKANDILQNKIAEQSVIEDSLRRSQENYLTLVNSIDGIVWEWDLRSERLTFVSEQIEQILGYSAEAWSSESGFWQEQVHGADREAVLSFRARVAGERRPGQFEYRMISHDGRTLWFRDMVTVVLEYEEAVKLRGVMVDITERKGVEEALNRERNFAQTVLETAGALVMILDVEGKIVRVNRAWERLSGYSFGEIEGKRFWDVFVVAEEIKRIEAVFARLLAGQFPANFESFLAAKDGSRKIIGWSNTVLLNKDGSVAHVVATGIDVTKGKEAEQKLKEAVADLARSNLELDRYSKDLKEANERLQKLDQLKSHFISAASHELRTPLTSAKGYVETVLEGEVGPLTAEQRQFLGYVKEATDRLHRLLNELLDISKIESGQAQMNLEPADLSSLIQEAVSFFKGRAEEKDISLAFVPAGMLQRIYCDGDKIREVLDNLISNAVKYTPKGGRVIVSAANENSGVQITVQDSGIGIKSEDLERVFEPFQDIDKMGAETEDSTGLGLALVKKIVEAHKGRVSVQSTVGKGSFFTVYLPRGERAEQKAAGRFVSAK